MSVTVSPNVIFLKDITHKNILVTLTSPGIFMYGGSQDKDGFFFLIVDVCALFIQNESICCYVKCF